MIKRFAFILMANISIVSVAVAAPDYHQVNQQITNVVNQSQQDQTHYRIGNATNNPFSALNTVVTQGLGRQAATFPQPNNPAYNTNTITATKQAPPTEMPTTNTSKDTNMPKEKTQPVVTTSKPSSSADAGISGLPDKTTQQDNQNNNTSLNF